MKKLNMATSFNITCIIYTHIQHIHNAILRSTNDKNKKILSYFNITKMIIAKARLCIAPQEHIRPDNVSAV